MPVTLVSSSPTCVMVNPSIPAKNLKELVAFVRANQKQLSYGSPGAGSINHLAGELFKQLVGAAELQHVAYKGAGPGVADLMGDFTAESRAEWAAAEAAYQRILNLAEEDGDPKNACEARLKRASAKLAG
jgi:tripartite-type tricarboxylate transporter receptor subunit TctC